MKKLIILGILLSPLFVFGQSETINVSGHGQGLTISNSADSAGTYITLTDYNGKRADIVSFDDNYPTSLYNNALMLFARNGKDMRFATSTDAGAGASKLVIKNNGLVGVGTNTPSARIDIKGDANINTNLKIEGNQTSGVPTLAVNRTFASYSVEHEDNRPFTIRRTVSNSEALHTFIQDGQVHFLYNNDEASSEIRFRLKNTDTEGSNTGANASDNIALRINSNSAGPKVSIGTTLAPDGYALGVDGRAIAQEVVVKLSGNWPDYVFSTKYSLMPLTDLSEYINVHKHLPEIPTAAEVEEKGQSLGEMNALLLKKIEELTLYVIDQNKELKSYKDKIDELTEKVRKLESR